MFNAYQIACAASYGGGDFAHVQTLDDVREVHDTLFTFLMVELSTNEGCETHDEALRRLAMAVANIEEVTEALHAA